MRKLCLFNYAVALILVLVSNLPCRGNPYEWGACCLENQPCVDYISYDCCSRLGGAFHLHVTCSSDPCTYLPPLGACCHGDSACTVVSDTDCHLSGGFFVGADIECSPCNPCVPLSGACCLGDGSCRIASSYECCLLGGDGLRPGECDPSPCGPAPVEAVSWGRIKSLYR